jgi:hypothetical protein
MKQFIIVFTFFSFLAASNIAQDQSADMVAGHESIVVPENIQSLLQQIQLAENNEDWNSYTQLREQLIQAWQQFNPEVAKLYRTVSGGTPDITSDGAPVGTQRTDDGESFQNFLEETRSWENPLWGDDKVVFNGRAADISMDVSRDGDIYMAISGRYDGSSARDTVYVLKSTDGGENWTEWSKIFASTQNFKQVELMLFDGQIEGSGTQPSYILLFYLFDNGWLRVGRTETATPLWNYYTISGSASGGTTSQFAVDRNNSATNYRAICLYDSLSGSNNWMKAIRSEPTSYGTVWQDAHSLGYIGRDLDLCYGWNGSVYAAFNGGSSGNLYARENTSYADPASWQTIVTVVQGTTDTTRHSQIIASREDIPNNIVALVFERQSGTEYDLYWALKQSGGTWGTMTGWVTTLEAKWPALYSRKVTGNQLFPGVFEQSEIGNSPPRSIRYKAYNGTSWSTSIQVSDPSIDVTGQEKPEVADINGNTPVFAYIGGYLINVYFDNFSWVPSDVNEGSNTPETYSLTQNYPNPFNPSTTIKYSIPEQSFVKIKVFNLLGQEIAELVNQEQHIGNYQLSFDATNLPSGIYFYKLEAGNFVQTKKMILIK